MLLGKLILLALLKIQKAELVDGRWASGLGAWVVMKGVGRVLRGRRAATSSELQKSSQRSQKGIKQRGGPLAGGT